MTHTQHRREQRLRALHALILRLDLRVEQIGTGSTVQVRGHGVDLIAASLAYIEPGDLRRLYAVECGT